MMSFHGLKLEASCLNDFETIGIRHGKLIECE